MILSDPTHAALADLDAEVTVIGAGPVGLITALGFARRGRRVLVLESGRDGVDAAAQDLAADALAGPGTHHEPRITVARRLGGTSNLWGGRCLPFDPIDFAPRPWLDLPGWPIGPGDLAPYLGPACAALDAGAPVFHDPVPGCTPTSEAFSIDTLERWSNEARAQAFHRAEIEALPNLHVALGCTVTDLRLDGDRVAGLTVWRDGPGAADLPVREVVLAAGGNASTRLLLAVQRAHPALFGGTDGPLGRFYMGHVNGQIADIVFENEALHRALDFYQDAHGSYVRRRILPSAATQEAHGLANVVFWPVVPEIAEASHRSGPLSALFLALSTPVLGRKFIAEPIRLKHIGQPPYARGRHLMNVLRDPIATLSFVPWFIWNRYGAKTRIPGFFLQNPGRRYGLEFHAEHLPGAESRMTLGDGTDRTGLPRLVIDLKFSDADVESVLRAHEALEAWLTAEGFARLVYRFEDRAAGVLVEAQHGNHQVGTIPMGASGQGASRGASHGGGAGVVDGWGTSHDLGNLHVISTAILPTSGQANPTLTAVQLGLRLVDRLEGDGARIGALPEAHAAPGAAPHGGAAASAPGGRAAQGPISPDTPDGAAPSPAIPGAMPGSPNGARGRGTSAPSAGRTLPGGATTGDAGAKAGPPPADGAGDAPAPPDGDHRTGPDPDTPSAPTADPEEPGPAPAGPGAGPPAPPHPDRAPASPVRPVERTPPAAGQPAAAGGPHRVWLKGLAREVPALGFGCASLGSRVAPEAGIAALRAAHAAGVRWFDLAPAYGGGAAEALFARAGLPRGDLVLVTKVGLAPPAPSPLKRLLLPAARRAVALAGPVRALIRRSGATGNRPVPLTPELLRSSLEASLTRLGTDHVDVYALHNADPADLGRAEILRTLEDLKATGKARAIAVAGGEDAARAAIARGAPLDVIQCAVPETGALAEDAAQAGLGAVFHSVFGVAGARDALAARLARDADLRARLEALGLSGSAGVLAARALMARARALNPDGVILASMFSERSLAENLAASAGPPDPRFALIEGL
ncbi:MAG: aldo/keto reductase [Pseudomonadota bacterium]